VELRRMRRTNTSIIWPRSIGYWPIG
jgi:hypothetical protein